MRFAQKLRQIRMDRNLTQEELGKLLGTSKQVISRYENGQRTPKITIAQEYAQRLQVPLNYLIDDRCEILEEPGSTKSVFPVTRIPILGRIAAGTPLYAEQNIEGYTYTDCNHNGEYFALRVHGDSMNAARICDDDILIVRRQDVVQNGEIAVVLVNGQEATVKKFYRNGNIVTLMPQSTNPTHAPQIYNLAQSDVCIQGKVVQVLITI